MSASAALSGTAPKQWVLSVMDAETAEPMEIKRVPFSRLERRVLEARTRILDDLEVPWRIDAQRVAS